MKHVIFMVLAAASLILTSCSDDDGDVPANPTRIISPAANQTFSQDFTIPDNKFVIEVTFNSPINTSSVVLGSSFKLTSGGADVAGTLEWNGDNTKVTFTSTQTFGDFCTFSPDCFIILTVEDAVRDANGNPLDGDSDGDFGGDYTTTFGILG